MVFQKGIIRSSDNSGVKRFKIININGKSRAGTVGSHLTVVIASTVKEIHKKRFSEKLYTGICCSVKRNLKRYDGSCAHISNNKIFVFNKQKHKWKGTRAFGCIPKELRVKKKDFQFQRIFSTIELIV